MKRKEALVAFPKRHHEEEVAPNKKKRLLEESVANSEIGDTHGAIVQGEARLRRRAGLEGAY